MAGQKCFQAFIVLFVVTIAAVNADTWRLPTWQRYPQGQPFSQQNRYQQPGNVELVEGTIDQLSRIDASWVCTNPKTGDQMIIGTETGNSNAANNNGYPQQNVLAGKANRWNPQRPYNPEQQVPVYNPQEQMPGYNIQGQVPGYNLHGRVPGYNQPGSIPQYNSQGQRPEYNSQGQLPGYNSQGQLPGYNSQGQLPGYNSQGQVPGYNPQGQLPESNFQQTQPTTNPEYGQHLQNLELSTTQPTTERHETPSSTLETTTDGAQNKFDNFDWTQYVTIRPVTSSTASDVVEYDGQGVLEPRSKN